VCTVTCNQGYNFPGNAKLTCYGSGHWSNNGYPVACKGKSEFLKTSSPVITHILS
jgi:hypothetical protein